MKLKKPVSYLIDFDSTFINTEGLDVLAEASLRLHPDKNKIVAEVKKLTTLAMEGKLSFEESLKRRVQLLPINKKILKQVSVLLKKEVSTSIVRNKDFFSANRNNIYIISGGFKELIEPVVAKFGIPSEHVFANTFVYDEKGNVIGIDETNPLSKDQGKVRVVRSLHLENDLFIIGDGYTDFELKKLGLAKKFIAFTENIKRKNVVNHADIVAHSFDEFLFVNKLPRSLSYPKNRISIALLSTIPDSDRSAFQNEGYQLVEENIHEQTIVVGEYQAIIKALPQIQNGRILAIGIVGEKHVDTTEIKKLGIAVFDGKNISTKIIKYINTGATTGSITIPNLALQQYKNSHRLLHIHKNTPGILANINTILADHKANILGLYLKTDKDIGYAIIDIDTEYDTDVVRALKRIPNTIRFRILY